MQKFRVQCLFLYRVTQDLLGEGICIQRSEVLPVVFGLVWFGFFCLMAYQLFLGNLIPKSFS